MLLGNDNNFLNFSVTGSSDVLNANSDIELHNNNMTTAPRPMKTSLLDRQTDIRN